MFDFDQILKWQFFEVNLHVEVFGLEKNRLRLYLHCWALAESSICSYDILCLYRSG